MVYEDIYDAKTAVDHLSGFNVANRYLIILYYNTAKHSKKVRLLQLTSPDRYYHRLALHVQRTVCQLPTQFLGSKGQGLANQ